MTMVDLMEQTGSSSIGTSYRHGDVIIEKKVELFAYFFYVLVN